MPGVNPEHLGDPAPPCVSLDAKLAEAIRRIVKGPLQLRLANATNVALARGRLLSGRSSLAMFVASFEQHALFADSDTQSHVLDLRIQGSTVASLESYLLKLDQALQRCTSPPSEGILLAKFFVM